MLQAQVVHQQYQIHSSFKLRKEFLTGVIKWQISKNIIAPRNEELEN